MGKFPSGNRQYNIQRLQSVHREILRRHFVGQKSTEIAEDMGLSAATISYTINNPLAKEVLADLNEGADANVVDVAARIHEIAEDAVEVLATFVEDDLIPPAIRLRAADSILDRAGHTPVKRIQASVAHGIFTSDDIERMKQAAKLAAGRCDQDTEYTIVEEAV